MRFDADFDNANYIIRRYERDYLQINEQVYPCNLILLHDTIITPWRPNSVAEIKLEDIQPLLDIRPEVILLGTGNKLTFPAIEILGAFANAGIGLESMDTPAACRTYNILTGEGRRVCAALFQLNSPT